MGRFARKYPLECEAELIRLCLDTAPALTVRAAVEAIAAGETAAPAVAMELSTARAYVRDEKRKRRPPAAPDPSELPDRLERLRVRLVDVLEGDIERVEKRARGPRGTVDAAHVRTLGQALRELRAGPPRGKAAKPAPTREREGETPAEPEPDAPAPASEAEALLERHRAQPPARNGAEQHA